MCWQCDNPTASKADYYRSMREKIDCYGWAVQWIERSKLYPSWAYTVGLTEHDLPELVVTGLQPDRAMEVLNGFAAHLMHAPEPEPGTRQQIRDDLSVEFVALTEPSAHLHTAIALCGSSVRAVQLVYPDDRGHWPWHPGFRGGRGGQPVLGRRTVPASSEPA